jgi:hypothetical protein
MKGREKANVSRISFNEKQTSSSKLQFSVVVSSDESVEEGLFNL